VSGKETTPGHFGLLIVCVIPGFTALHGLPAPSAALAPPSLSGCGADATIAGFLFGSVEAITAGLIVSAVRWLVIDTLHHATGLRRPDLDFASFGANVPALEFLVRNHYWYYQFYANMVVAFAYAGATLPQVRGTSAWAYAMLAILFLLASRDALRKFYDRAARLLPPRGDAHGPVLIIPA
jgi:hypothetical protein